MERILTLMACMALGVAPAAEADESQAVDQLAWMAGCWTNSGGEVGSGEQWTIPAGGTMLGVSRVVKDSQTVAHEFMQIRETEDGGIVFIANPSGQEGATFTMVSLEDGRIVFENLEHDFPQRIIYFRTESGGLGARIEGEIDGALRRRDFPMERVDCVKDPMDH